MDLPDDPRLRLLDGLAEAALRDDALADETHRGGGQDPEAVRAAAESESAPSCSSSEPSADATSSSTSTMISRDRAASSTSVALRLCWLRF